jgi:hypothetical protein
MRFRVFCLVPMIVLLACSGTRLDDGSRIDPDKEKLIDALTVFVEAVQGDRFEKAMGYLTLEEKAKMTEGTGQVSPPVQKQLKALRLSTLASKPGVHLEKGKLAGIYAWLPNIERSVPGEAPPPRDSVAPLIQ